MFDEKLIQCSGCSKESYDTIPTSRIIAKLDELFAENDLNGVDRLLEYWDREARNLNDIRGLLAILNEEIGYYRRISDKESALKAVDEAFKIMTDHHLDDSRSSGTIYLNAATTMKAFGKAQDAMQYYAKAKNIYDKYLTDPDYRMAAYYNNISSAYLDIGDKKNAQRSSLNAIEILEKCGNCQGEIAVTLVNLAHMYYEDDPCDERVYGNMERAWQLLCDKNNIHDGNFAFICSKCSPSFAYFGYFEYEKKLKKLMEKIYAGN